MRTLSLLVCTALLGCQQGSSPHEERLDKSVALPSQTPFGRDLDRICHSSERSGALEQPEGQRAVTVAYWLGNNIESDEGRAFLARFTKSSTEEKIALLRREAKRVGLSSCPLLQTWGGSLIKKADGSEGPTRLNDTD